MSSEVAGERFNVAKIEWIAIGVCVVMSFLPSDGTIFSAILLILYAFLFGFLVEKSSKFRLPSEWLTKYITIITPIAFLGSFFLYQIIFGAIESFSHLIGLILASLLFLFIWSLGAFLKRYLVTKQHSISTTA